MTKEELREISEQIFNLECREGLDDAGKKELVELKAKFENGMRELNLNAVPVPAKVAKMSEQTDELREWIKGGGKKEFELREAVAGTARTDVAEVESKVLHPVMDATPYAETVYDKAGCPIQYGAKGLQSWPFVNNATVSIKGELNPIGDAGKLDFSDVQEVRNRLTAKILISWQAIEDSAVDLVAIARRKIAEAYQQAINHAACSTAKWANTFYGGFAHTSKQTGTYAATGFTFADAMEMVGKVAEKEYGIEGGVFVMGAADYYALKATPKDSGSGLMVIDDFGRIGGFPVLIDNNINRTSVKGAISGNNIGFGLFRFLPCMQHGSVRLTVDANSMDAADVDGVYLICNADWSMTDLRPDAFVVYGKAAAQGNG